MNPYDYQSIVVLTGAGISAESGLKTFRASDGLWENHRVEDVATPGAFVRDPQLVHTFYNERRRQLLNGIQPNAAHQALAKFEQQFPGKFTLVTQNIDNLHEQAGSKNLYHMHGELLKVRCTNTYKVYPWEKNTQTNTVCDCCEEKGTLRPHIVWFGEMPFYMDNIEQALTKCDLFVSIGTSGHVYPAAGFVEMARAYRADTVELNLEPSAGTSFFKTQVHGPATDIVPKFFLENSDQQ